MPRDMRLTSFRQDLSEIGSDVAYDVVQFAGDVQPILVKQNNTFRILRQSGSAVAWDAALNPPAPLFPDALVGRPETSQTRDENNPFAFITTWSYVMALDDADSYDKFVHALWPVDPETEPGFTELPDP